MYEALFHGLLTGMDPERAHDRAIGLLERASRNQVALSVLARAFSSRGYMRPVRLMGLEFAHPLGLAGGFDKDARAIPALAALGFSFIEVGTVTPRPQPGNSRPRLFRLSSDRALINRMGFPSAGMSVVGERLRRLAGNRRLAPVPLFVSLGKNKDTPLEAAAADYLAVLGELHDLADAFVVNISSPNTPELRRLQTPRYLDGLLASLAAAVRGSAGSTPAKPLLVKISPDIEPADLDALLASALANGIAAIIATNTTTERVGLASPAAGEPGGLSGRPLARRSTDVVQHIRRETAGRMPVIGVGGIFTGDDVAAKLDAGASLVQAYTGFIYRGPGFVRQVLRELSFRKAIATDGAAATRALSWRAD